MHEEYGLQFRVFVPTLMELLEDADGMVRDIARHTVIELFKTAPNAAKSDLKKQLKIFNVRPTIVSTIMAQLGPGGPVETDSIVQENAIPQAKNHLADSIASQSSVARPVTPVTERKVELVDPAYVNTQRELEDTFRDMHPFFEGKESEQNWLKREQSCTKIRKLNAGNAPSDFHDAWLLGIKGLLDGILKAVNSLRTSLSKEGCSVIQEAARTSGPGFDPMVEILLQNLIKLCGGTKKIASQAGDATVDVIISHVSYSTRILQHIWLACQDKNVQPRTYAAGWLKTLLKKESHHKNHVEHTGGLELIEKCIKKGLADANPGVREKMRGTFWAFAQIWPTKADAIMATLDPAQLKLLQNDPANPNSPKKADPVVRPGLGFSKSTAGPPKPSLREAMLAQKKAALAAKNLPIRPGSAMSSFSPVKIASTTSVPSSTSHSSQASASRSRPEAVNSVSHGGLSVAPMRPTKFRPKEVARPATAGPYSVRQPPTAAHGPAGTGAGTSTATPSGSKLKTRTPSTTVPSPKRTVPRPNTSHSSHTIQSNTSPVRERPVIPREEPSPQESPKIELPTHTYRPLSPSKADEDFTLVMPSLTNLPDNSAAPISSPISKENRLTTPAKPLKVWEDPFSAVDDETTPRPILTVPVLEEVPINEDAHNLTRIDLNPDEVSKTGYQTPDRSKQNSRLLDSGINKVKTQSLDVHGFRKLQGLIRDSNKTIWTDQRFDALLIGLFGYLEAPLTSLAPEKVQDVKAQILSTIKIMLKKDRETFAAHTAQGLDSILATRSRCDARAHIVSGLELLANDLVTLGDPTEIAGTITTRLQSEEMTTEGCRTLSMGLHILKELLDATMSFVPTDEQAEDMGKLAMRCLDSTVSGVRMDAVQLCVALHSRIGEKSFWSVVNGVKDDPKSLITYYIVKRQKEVVAL